MSDYEMGDSDDDQFYDQDDDAELEQIRRDHEAAQARARAAAQPARRPTRRSSPPLDPFAAAAGPAFRGFPGGVGGAGGGLFSGRNIGDMLGAAGLGPGMRPSPEAFRANYVAYSTSIHEASEGRMDRINGGRQNLMFGGNILMPPEALDQLTRMEIEGPWTFDLISPTDQERRVFAGVLEFTASPGTVYLPQWMMTHLGFSEGSNIRINGASLPKGKFVKLEPQEITFLELANPKAVLEVALSNYAALTVGSIVEISHQHIQLSFKILETKPDHKTGIEIRNTDIEVDFAPPVGYVPPQPKPREPLPTMASKLGINVDATHEADGKAAGGYNAFVGTGNSVGGKRIKGKGTKTKKIEALPQDSRVRRTDRETFINANNMQQDDEVPAPLRLPFGHLFFGFPLQPLRAQDGVAATANGPAADAQPSFTGSGATLSGRMRPQQQPAAESSSSAPTAAAPSSAFSGSGNTLSARKPAREVIEID